MEMNIETAVRICPINCNNSDIVCIQSNPITNTIQFANAQNFTINYALPIDCCQNNVFTITITPLVNYLMEGCDVSIVAMGQSGTGKSYTLLGPGFHFTSSESEYGIIPRFIREIFTKCSQHRDRTTSIHIAWSQICGDNVQDLLGAGSVECTNIGDVFQLISLGMSNIAPKCAHTLFTFTLEQQWIVDATIQHRISTASFADLAGCEKILMYNSTGMMQTVPTDPGLQTLQRCILALSDCYSNQYNFIPYTQSVLTTLLKDSFGGRAKTLLICCVSPLIQDFNETLYTLQLALRAQMIKNIVTVNSYTTFESIQDTYDIFGLQFAANQLLKLVSNAEELFQKLVSSGMLSRNEQEQISQWLTLKQECEDCLSENSEPHRSLERIDEEIEGSYESSNESEIIEDDDKDNLLEKVQILMQNFTIDTDRLVNEINTKDLTINPQIKESTNSNNNEYHLKGARGRRGSIHSAEELPPTISMNSSSKISEEDNNSDSNNKNRETLLSYETKKKLLKQITIALNGCQKQIIDYEETIKVKENLRMKLLKYKNTKSNARYKIEQKCQHLRKDYENAQTQLTNAQLQKNYRLEQKFKKELEIYEKKLHDAESLKNITNDDSNQKLMELESSLHTSKKQLEKLKKYKYKEEKRKQLLEKQINDEKINKSNVNNNNSCDSLNKSINKTKESKALVLLHSSMSINSNISLSNEDLECLRHEIRNLRKTRDYLLEQRCKIDLKSHHKKLLNEIEERKLLQYEEAIEAIDLAIEYKNQIICGNQPLFEKIVDDPDERILMERVLKLSENEMRILLHKYFEKVIELRSSSKILEMQVIDIENKNENLAYRVINLNDNLQKVRLEAERRIISLQQQHEDKLEKIMQHLANDNNDNNERVMSRVLERSEQAALTLQMAGGSKQMDKGSIIARFTRYARHETVPRQLQAIASAPQAKVTRQKNKIFIQQTNK